MPRAEPPLPQREGVAPSFVWLPPGQWPSLLAFLCQRFPAIDESRWLTRMRDGDVRDGEGTRLGPDAPYRAGLQIFYYREIDDEPPIPFEEKILFQDERLLVADKPHFLPVTPSGRFLRQTLLVRLRQRTGIAELAPIHRLDRETAGLVIFSTDPATRGCYQALFRDRQVRKDYEAVSTPAPDLVFPLTRATHIESGPRFFTMQEVEGSPNSFTRIEVLARGEDRWLYGLQPETGKTHQLRLHMLGLGLPILNDLLYPVVHPVGAENFSRPLQLLARRLRFIDPVSGEERCFESSLQLQQSPACNSSSRSPAVVAK